MKIVFVATSDFALPTLALLRSRHTVSAVITNPDAPGGRGKKQRPSPVKEAALKLGIAVYDRPIETLEESVRALKPDILVVAAYGSIIPPCILAIPSYGALNVHPSLLPKYRGASPIHEAILNGDKETGVTIIQMTDKLDAGPIVSQKTTSVSDRETAGTLHSALANTGAELLQKTLEKTPPFHGVAQEESAATYTKKITPENAKLDLRKSAVVLERKVRAYNPTPGAHITITNYQLLITSDALLVTDKSRVSKRMNMRLKIWRAEIKKCAHHARSLTSETNLMVIHGLPALLCGDGNFLMLTEVQPEGRKRMSGEEFVRGYVR